LDVDVTQGGGTPTLPTNLPTQIDPTVIVSDVLACLRSGSLTSAACKKVLAKPSELLKLREECAKPRNRDKDVCRELNMVPGLPPPPELPVPTGPGLPTSLPSLPGLGRAPLGEARTDLPAQAPAV